jgi:selenide,water dikinase
MATLNFMGEFLGDVVGVHAMTDVTGFGLIGHLTEMVDKSRLTAELHYADIPLLEGTQQHAANMIYPDNTMRNWKAYGEKVKGISGESLLTLCDPQTNGGLLFSVDPNAIDEVQALFQREHVALYQIGSFKENTGFCVDVI